MIKLKPIYSCEDFRSVFNEVAAETNLEQTEQVMQILQTVRKNKDQALREYTAMFDRQEITDFRVPVKLLQESYDALKPSLQDALKFIKQRIESYEIQIRHQDIDLGEFKYVYHPLEKVGFYVPGGQALYPSSVLMSIIAAKVAGVSQIHVVTPTYTGNNITFASLFICGVENVYTVGGAQAIAALAYGTETIPKVDKIVGPGNSFVANAKRLVFGEVGIDMIAGPSEILVYIDQFADPDAVVFDLFAQAEHDPEARTFLLAESSDLLEIVRLKAIEALPAQVRAEIIAKSLQNNHYSIVGNRNDLINIINYVAPEHVSIQHQAAAEIIPQIKYAGAVFQGNYSPEAVGDYVAGPSHVLPTNQSARFSHGLNVNDFLTSHAIINIEQNTFQNIVDPAIEVAEAEGLFCHAESLKIRKN
ncbi:MAG TPA: histidinol dehydrogenase [Clostridiaceae bacterium]|nr:histidinol dehydrogenase [Clostridiaceae bacterium]